MVSEKDKEAIIAALNEVDVKDMDIEHHDETIVKWFRFGGYTGLRVAAEIIRQMSEKP